MLKLKTVNPRALHWEGQGHEFVFLGSPPSTIYFSSHTFFSSKSTFTLQRKYVWAKGVSAELW